MKKQYHILNGDSLKNQLQHIVFDEFIITRECLVDGDVSGETPEDFYTNRAHFLASVLHEKDTDFYYRKTVSEFSKIQNIPEKSEIVLWFEDDLFCQVNLWFVFHLLNAVEKNSGIFLVRPNSGNEYNFGNMTDNELMEAYQKKIKFEPAEVEEFGKLWDLYRKKEIPALIEIANRLQNKFAFLLPAIHAFSELIPEKGKLNRPAQTILDIINHLNTVEFEPIFHEFCKREAIYGFGDLQVQRILNGIKFFIKNNFNPYFND